MQKITDVRCGLSSRDTLARRFWLAVAWALVAPACVELRPNEQVEKGDASVDSAGMDVPDASSQEASASDVSTQDLASEESGAGAPSTAADSDTADADESNLDAVESRVTGTGDANVPDQADDRFDAEPIDAVDVGPSDAGAADVCIPNCTRFGDFRCSAALPPATSRQIEICSLARGCLQWLPTATCGDDEFCCHGACRALDSAAACEADYYVDAVNGSDDRDAGPDAGSQAMPFRTITFAVRSAQTARTPGRRIHVAAGRYDAALGEQFPIVLRGGISLLGAGPDLVLVQGAGNYDRAPDGGPVGGQYFLTFLVGDAIFPTVMSGMSVRGDSGTPIDSHQGILCDRGNAAIGGYRAGTTSLENLVLGPGYDTAIVATSSTAPAPSGCNLRLTSSRVSGGFWGLSAVGCQSGMQRIPVWLQVGGQTVGNEFRALKKDPYDGGGIYAGACVTNSSVVGNLFSNSGSGVLLDQGADPGPPGSNTFVVKGNQFTGLTEAGVYVGHPATSIEQLDDNSFIGNVKLTATQLAAGAFAMVVYGQWSDYPHIKARRNTFIGNDSGLMLGQSLGNVVFGPNGPIDFGRAEDPGGNTFHCNSLPVSITSGAGGAGGDVYLYATGTGSIPFAGNVWDHLPLTRGVEGIATNGDDLIVHGDPLPVFDVTNGTVNTSTCPNDRTAGPP